MHSQAVHTEEEKPSGPLRTSGRHVLVLGGLSVSLINFRGSLIKALLAKGHRVTAVAGNYDAAVAETLSHWGGSYQAVRLARSGMNPLSDLASLFALVSTISRIKPDIFLGYTVKAVSLGLISARLAGVPRRYALITGLGYAFIEGPELKRRLAKVIARFLYRIALKFAHVTIFQNPDDELYFKNSILGRKSATAVVAGSGVDLSYYAPAPLPSGSMVFLMVARLLRDKGVAEFVQAARTVKKADPRARFVLVGPLDPSPDAIKHAQVQAWVDEGAIEYKGPVGDIRPEIAACHVYVLPSYHEGTPRTVLEALAMGRPIITTDAPGCRETVNKDFSNGILIPVRDGPALAGAAQAMLNASIDDLEKMGKASLRLAQGRFDVRLVNADVMRIIDAS